MDVVTELERLNELHRSGALTTDEFSAAKAAILAGRPDSEAAADGGVAELDGEWAPTREAPDYDAMPDERSASDRPAWPGMSGMYGMHGDVIITDANGQPIDVSMSPGLDQPIRRSLKAGIGQSARMGVLFGLVFVVAGIWLGVGGRRGGVTFNANVPHHHLGGTDLTGWHG